MDIESIIFAGKVFGGGGDSDGVIWLERRETGFPTKVRVPLLAGSVPYKICDSTTSTKTMPYKFIEEVEMPEGATAIDMYAFNKCSYLSVIGPLSGLQSIGSNAFNGCSALREFSWPEGLEEIESAAFSGSGIAGSQTFPESLSTIATNVFKDAVDITSVLFEGAPSSVASSAFNGCTGITDIYVPWSEGEIAGAPWGATNATVHYNWEG